MRLSVQLLVALLASAQVSHSWVLTTNTLPTSIQNANKQALRWGFPIPGQDRGLSLGQGILYAISPEFLVDMVPLFPLEFLSADYLKESIGRGFSTWESNNPVRHAPMPKRQPSVQVLGLPSLPRLTSLPSFADPHVQGHHRQRVAR